MCMIDYFPFKTPSEVAKQAVDSDVHIIGVSTLAAAHRTLLPALLADLKRASPNRKIGVICGGVVPNQDIPQLKAAGVIEVFGPGTEIPKAALHVLRIIEENATKSKSK